MQIVVYFFQLVGRLAGWLASFARCVYAFSFFNLKNNLFPQNLKYILYEKEFISVNCLLFLPNTLTFRTCFDLRIGSPSHFAEEETALLLTRGLPN